MQTTRQRIDGTNQHCHKARHFSQFELRMGEISPEAIVFREANYLSLRLLINENYDKKSWFNSLLSHIFLQGKIIPLYVRTGVSMSFVHVCPMLSLEEASALYRPQIKEGLPIVSIILYMLHLHYRTLVCKFLITMEVKWGEE